MKKPIKSHVILLELIRGRSLNRFEASREGDTCLNSTIAELQRKLQFHIYRERENVPCRTGKVSVNRYSIPNKEDRQRAAEWLAAQLVVKGKFQNQANALASIAQR